MFRIAVCGQGRAGSSFLYEACSLILGQNGIKHASNVGRGLEHSFDCRTSCLLKYHPWRQDIEDWATHLILPRRDLREVVSSYNVNLKGVVTNEREARAATQEAISLHMQWHGKAPVEFVYEDLRADPETYLMELSQHLGLECSPGGILDQLGRPPKRKPWSLPMSLMRAIEGQGREWLDRFGYPPLEEINNPCEPYSK